MVKKKKKKNRGREGGKEKRNVNLKLGEGFCHVLPQQNLPSSAGNSRPGLSWGGPVLVCVVFVGTRQASSSRTQWWQRWQQRWWRGVVLVEQMRHFLWVTGQWWSQSRRLTRGHVCEVSLGLCQTQKSIFEKIRVLILHYVFKEIVLLILNMASFLHLDRS